MLKPFTTPELTLEDFELIRKLVNTLLGIKLNDSKRTMVMSRLSSRLKALGVSSFKQYLDYIHNDPAGHDELVHFINKITTNETYFFREEKHFEFIATKLVPLWAERYAKSREPVRIWSAACSSGEEPYSIVITIYEAMKKFGKFDFKILGTDINSEVLQTAKDAIYREDYLRKKVRQSVLDEYFDKLRDGTYQVKHQYRQHTNFRKVNLMGDRYPLKKPLDLVICRNVMIYFDNKSKDTVIKRFHDCIATGGHLIIGHSENLFHFADKFKSLGHTIYKKI